MYEQSVKTATGKEFNVRFCAATTVGVTPVLYIEFIGYSMMDIVPVFADKNETRYMEGLVEGEVVKQYQNYTHLIESNILADNGNLRIALVAPVEVLGGM